MSETELNDERAPDAVMRARPVIVSRFGAIVVVLSLFAAIAFSLAALRSNPALAKRVDSFNSDDAVRSPLRLPHGERAFSRVGHAGSAAA